MRISNHTLFTLTTVGLAVLALGTFSAHWNSENYSGEQSETVLENGIIIIYESKILLAEKFFPIEFLVPFPKFELNIRDELDDFLKKN